MYGSSNFPGGGQFGQQPPQQPPQYGQQQPTPGFQQPQQQQQQQQPQPTGFMPQSTGLMGSQLQPQPTGFSGSPSPFSSQPPQQPQQPQQPGSQFGSSLQPPGMAAGFQQQSSLQPQHTAFQPQQQPQAQPQQPQHTQFQQPSINVQPTGFPTASHAQQPQNSSQIAQSFQTVSQPQAGAASQQSQAGAKIPSQRLSFITATDQAKFEQLFKSAVGDGQSLDGETAKGLLLRSNLPGTDLSKIWYVFTSNWLWRG